MIFFKPKKTEKEDKEQNLQVNVDLEIITKMNRRLKISIYCNNYKRKLEKHYLVMNLLVL